MLIDTHSHLYLHDFTSDIYKVVERAIENDVKKIILPNIDSASVYDMNNLEKKFPDILYSTLGLHPTSVKKDFKKDLDSIFSNNVDSVVAIGEIGIDLYWDGTFFKEQQEAFEFQLNIAFENKLPVIIHSRNSMKEIMDIMGLYKDKGLKGVFHCYPGNYEEAVEIIDMGFYLGIGGVLTYKKSHLPEVVARIPLEYLLLETDAPYLSPVPFRGKRNEPAHVKIIAEKLSELKKLDFSIVKKQTTLNAENIFTGIVGRAIDE